MNARLQELHESAFTALGVTAEATREEIERAARQLRVLAGAVANDQDGLGNRAAQSAGQVEHALMMLTEPESRCRERLWAMCQTASPPEIVTRHDEAVRLLATRDAETYPLEHQLGHWRFLLAEFTELARSHAYREWLWAVEVRGDFEKCATREELGNMQERIALPVAEEIGRIACDYIETNWTFAAKVAGVLRDALPNIPLFEAASIAVTARVEDQLKVECEEARAVVADAWGKRNTAGMLQACVQTMKRGVLAATQIDTFFPRDDRRMAESSLRVRTFWTQTLSYTADAAEAIHNKRLAVDVLDQALCVAGGTMLEAELQRRRGKLGLQLMNLCRAGPMTREDWLLTMGYAEKRPVAPTGNLSAAAGDTSKPVQRAAKKIAARTRGQDDDDRPLAKYLSPEARAKVDRLYARERRRHASAVVLVTIGLVWLVAALLRTGAFPERNSDSTFHGYESGTPRFELPKPDPTSMPIILPNPTARAAPAPGYELFPPPSDDPVKGARDFIRKFRDEDSSSASSQPATRYGKQ